MGMTDTQRETAAQLLAETMVSTEWRDLHPFARAKYRTAILTIERIFARAQSEDASRKRGE